MTLITALQQNDPAWYTAVTGNLTEEQKKEIDEIFKLAEQRRAAAGNELCFKSR